MTEVKPISAGELTKLASKVVQCKSMHAYKIRKMPLPVMASFFNKIDMRLSKDVSAMETSMQEQLSDPVKTEKLILAMRDVLPQCIVEPKVTSTEPSSDTVINVDDIPLEDQFELFGFITDFAGISIDKLKENESFRTKSDR